MCESKLNQKVKDESERIERHSSYGALGTANYSEYIRLPTPIKRYKLDFIIN